MKAEIRIDAIREYLKANVSTTTITWLGAIIPSFKDIADMINREVKLSSHGIGAPIFKAKPEGSFKDSAYLLNKGYDWKLWEDDEGNTILVPLIKGAKGVIFQDDDLHGADYHEQLVEQSTVVETCSDCGKQFDGKHIHANCLTPR